MTISIAPIWTDIPETLRRIADGLEAGEYEASIGALLLHRAGNTEVFGLGAGSDELRLLGLIESSKSKLL